MSCILYYYSYYIEIVLYFSYSRLGQIKTKIIFKKVIYIYIYKTVFWNITTGNSYILIYSLSGVLWYLCQVIMSYIHTIPKMQCANSLFLEFSGGRFEKAGYYSCIKYYHASMIQTGWMWLHSYISSLIDLSLFCYATEENVDCTALWITYWTNSSIHECVNSQYRQPDLPKTK